MKEYAKEFTISTEPQRTIKWHMEHAGISSASSLGALFDTLRDGKTPSAKSKQYRRQLAFERKFGVTYERFQTKAMADGVFFEDFAKKVYAEDTGNKLEEAYSYISDWFVATPDAIVTEPVTRVYEDPKSLEKIVEGGAKGLLECKVVGDETFIKIIEDGIPPEHDLQTQGQLMASGYDWVDYIVVNLKTKAYIILRRERNDEQIKEIYARLHEPLDLPELNTDKVRQFDESLLREFMDGKQVEPTELVIEGLPF